MTQSLRFVSGKVENIMGKGENAGYQHFLLFPKCFHSLFFKVIQSWNCVVKSKPFPKQEILGSSKLKEFAGDNFKFNENDRVENTVGKEEIACHEQLLLFPQCF